MAGKGDKRRPPQISKEEEDLRWAFAEGAITREHFREQYQELLQRGKVIRNGRVIRLPLGETE